MNELADDYDAALQGNPPGSGLYMLRLYVSGLSRQSLAAIERVRALCDQYLPGQFELEVIDIYLDPSSAQQQQIVAAPTLVKLSPPPQRRLVGNFTDQRRTLIGLGILDRGVN